MFLLSSSILFIYLQIFQRSTKLLHLIPLNILIFIMKSQRVLQIKPINLSESIKQQLSQIQKMNNELLTISDQVQFSTILQPNKQRISSKNLALEFQKQIRNTLQGVIENIKEFYLDIDKKLKNVALAISHEINDQHNQDFKYNILFDKVKNLEFSLKKTQENETKLLQIIETMMQKYQITDQPTLLRDEPLMRQRQNTVSTQNLISGSQRMQSPLLTENPNIERSFHENLYVMDESVVSASLSSLKLNNMSDRTPNDQVYIKKLYSKSSLPNQQKKSLKIDNKNFNICGSVNKNSFYKPGKESVQFEDKKHRLNFMMDKLKK